MGSSPGWVFGYVPTATEWNNEFAIKADEANAVLTGAPTSPTPPSTDNNLRIATTAFVKQSAIYALASISALRLNVNVSAVPIFVRGFATDQDGGEGIFVYVSTDTTSADNGGTVVVDQTGKRWHRVGASEGVDIRWFGAKGDGTTDCTTAIQAAVNTGLPVFIPGQQFAVNNTITIGTKGQRIFGVGRTVSQILVSASFNLGATATFNVTTGEPGPIFQDFGILYARSVGGSNDLTAYPPAISAKTCPRFKLLGMRIAGATICVDMRGNSGGAHILDCEFSFLSKGLFIDGCLDTVRVANCHFWPFNMPAGNQQFLAMTQQGFGIHSGRMDDLQIENTLFLCFYGLVTFEGTFDPSNPGFTGAHLVGCTFDTGGGVNMTAGNVQLIGCALALGVVTSQPIAVTSSGTDRAYMLLSGCYFSFTFINTTPAAAMIFSGLSSAPTFVTITGCMFNVGFSTLLDATSIIRAGDNTQISIVGNRFRIKNTAALPIMDLQGSAAAQYSIVGNFIGPGPAAGATGTAVSIGSDSLSVINGNNFSGWPCSLPSGYVNIHVSGNIGLATGNYVNVTSSRSLGTSNTNSHSQSLLVNVSVSSSSLCTINASVNSATVATQIFPGGSWGSVSFVAPSGSHYGVSTDTGTLQLWTEQAI